jgi:lysophospholipase L1-like esterase
MGVVGFGVVVLLGLWPSAPVMAASPAYTALGDSYSSGVGAGGYSDPGGCRRSANAYPVRVAQRLGARLTFAACSGARAGDVQGQLGSLGAATAYVSVSVGGNDAGFSHVLIECAKPWPWDCSDDVAGAQAYIRGSLPGILGRLYSKIRALAPRARVAVVGYPRLFKPDDSCWAGAKISKLEVRDLNRTADLLRDVVRAQAQAQGFRFADPMPSFAGHAVCDSGPWLHGLASPLGDSFHPNASGQAHYAELVEAALR